MSTLFEGISKAVFHRIPLRRLGIPRCWQPVIPPRIRANLIYPCGKSHSMEHYRFLAFSLPFIPVAAAAQETSTLGSESAWLMGLASSYYLPVVGGILLLFVAASLANRATRRRYSSVEFLATISGLALGIILILTGLVFWAAASVLAWGTATRDLSYGAAEDWAVPLSNEIQYFIQPALDMVAGPPDSSPLGPYMQNILLGAFLIGGGILIVVGILLLWKLPKSSFYEIVTPGKTTTFREVMKRGQEPLAPTVTFKVIDRLTNQPSPDVKVILKHKEGAKVYNRYTDFNGEVVFQKIDGLYSQYYAYVEGDEERKRYWVIRTAIGAESVT